MSELRSMAEALANELESCGHEDIAGVDILDALASTHLVLAEAPERSNPAAEVYLESLPIRSEITGTRAALSIDNDGELHLDREGR